MAERSSTWTSHFWSMFTGGRSKPTNPSGASKGQVQPPLHPQGHYDPELPQVPKATLTGLRSVIDKFGHSKAEKTRANGYTNDQNLTLMTVDYDYHRHLRAGATYRQPLDE